MGHCLHLRSLPGCDAAAPECADGPPPRLTPAEQRLAPLLETELTYAEIARQWGRHPETVRFQAKALFRKLGVRSRHAAVARLIRAGLTRTGD